MFLRIKNFNKKIFNASFSNLLRIRDIKTALSLFRLMKKAYSLVFLLLISFLRVHADVSFEARQDTAQVNLLNKQGFSIRLTDHEQTIKKAQQALELAQKLNFVNGIAESYRILGVGEAYSHNITLAMANYLNALSYFKRSNNLLGQAKVYNNIGNLYLDIDYDAVAGISAKGIVYGYSNWATIS